MLPFDYIELIQQGGMVGIVHDSIGEWEQYLIFFGDMCPQQFHILTGGEQEAVTTTFFPRFKQVIAPLKAAGTTRLWPAVGTPGTS